MAIAKSDAQVQSLSVAADGSVTAKVNYLLADSGTEITRVVVDVPITNATSGELTAAASLVSKAAVLAVA
jgi:hypothetical protein